MVRKKPPFGSYEDLLPWIRNAIRWASRGIPRHLREDYTQDMVLRLLSVGFLERLDSSRSRDDCKAYLHLTVRNNTSNWLRGHGRRWGKYDFVEPWDEALDVPGDAGASQAMVDEGLYCEWLVAELTKLQDQGIKGDLYGSVAAMDLDKTLEQVTEPERLAVQARARAVGFRRVNKSPPPGMAPVWTPPTRKKDRVAGLVWISDQELAVMRDATGRRAGHNYFLTTRSDEAWLVCDGLVGKGLMRVLREPLEDQVAVYMVTAMGLEVLRQPDLGVALT